MEESNEKLASNVSSAMRQVASEIAASVSSGGSATGGDSNPGKGGNTVSNVPMPVWMRWTITASVVIVALACVANTIYNVFIQ